MHGSQDPSPSMLVASWGAATKQLGGPTSSGGKAVSVLEDKSLLAISWLQDVSETQPPRTSRSDSSSPPSSEAVAQPQIKRPECKRWPGSVIGDQREPGSCRGVSAFPCCGKDSVDIVERTDNHHHQPHTYEDKDKAREDKEPELEAELPKQEPPPKVQPDLDPGPVPQLEEMGPVVPSKPTSAARGESPEQEIYKVESPKSYKEELSSTNRTWTFSASSSHREEEQVPTQFRSIRVQTSTHLFWANKLIQASEHSLQQALEKHPKSAREKKSVSISQVLTECPPLPSSTPVSCTNLPTSIGLAELINFASSLAVASSSNKELPTLESMIKSTSEKTQDVSMELCQPIQAIKFSQATQITQISSEKTDKSPQDVTSHKSWTQETRNVACSYLDFSKTGLKKATIQGEVKFIQAPTPSPQLQGVKEDSVPGTKKGSPLLLKIHFKLSSPSPPEK